MKKIVAIDDSESILYLTKLALGRVSYEVQMLLDPNVFHPRIVAAPDHVSEGEFAKATGPCGADGYLSKAWGVEQRIACLQPTRGHHRSGVE